MKEQLVRSALGEIIDFDSIAYPNNATSTQEITRSNVPDNVKVAKLIGYIPPEQLEKPVVTPKKKNK
jgi:hypothetical protein